VEIRTRRGDRQADGAHAFGGGARLVDTFELDEQLVTEALSQAILHDHSIDDLLYVVLAMRFGARLLSAAGKLLKLAARIDPSMV
jgi:predicted nucleic acid-binding protein